MLKSILIVDDSPVARMIMKKCLPPDHNFTIYEAGNGKEGLAKYIQHQPDLTFLDLTMPVMDGFVALTKIKIVNPLAVVIVATADIQEKVLQRVAGLGALQTLKKPPSRVAVAEALQLAATVLKELEQK